jgi:hypothetical protein
MTSADSNAPGPEDSSKEAAEFRDIAKRSAEAGIADELNRAYEPDEDAEPAGQGETGKSAEHSSEGGSAE